MSADNWAQCPRCRARGNREIVRRTEEIESVYGKVSVEEFDRLRAALTEFQQKLNDASYTFREDYEFYGAEDGEVTASYRGWCTKCDLTLEFEDSHVIPKWQD
jgi:hypothetical protein